MSNLATKAEDVQETKPAVNADGGGSSQESDSKSISEDVADSVEDDCKSELLGAQEDEDQVQDEPLLDEMVEKLSADLEAFSKAADELENMSADVRSLIRSVDSRAARPDGLWKDLC